MASLPMRLRFAYYRLSLLALGKEAKWARSVAGPEMFFDPADPLDRSFYVGNFAHALRLYIKRFVKPGDVAIDGGAQKGFITMHLRQAVGPHGRVIAFEPDPRAVRLLRANCERNRFKNVTVMPCALGERDAQIEFLLSTQLGYSSAAPYPKLVDTLSEKTTVEQRAFDSIAGDFCLPRIDFVKLDCQGFEARILAGMKKTIERHRPTIWFEIDHQPLAAAASSEGEIEDFFKSRGYQLFMPSVPRFWQMPLGLRLDRLDQIPIEPRGDFDVVATLSG